MIHAGRRQWQPTPVLLPGNPRDGGAWWAAVHGVAKSGTRLRDFTFTFPFMHWGRKWQPTLVFLPGESQGWGSLVGCCLWGRTELDTTEATEQQQQYSFMLRKINLWVCYFSHWINSLCRSKKQLLQKLPNSCHCARPACWNMGQSLWLSSLFPHSDFHPARKTVAGTGTKHPSAVHLKAVFQRLPPLRPQVKQHRWKFVGVVIILLSSPCCNAVNHHLVIQSPQMQHLWYHLFFHNCSGCACEVASVMSDFLWSAGLWPIRLFCPWDSPGKNTGVTCHALLQRYSWPRDRNLVSFMSCIGRWVLYH